MASRVVEECLVDLQKTEPKRATALLENLSASLSQEMEAEEADICLEVVLGPGPSSLTSQLVNSTKDAAMKQMRGPLLMVLHSYTVGQGSRIRPYANTLRNMCIKFVRADSTSAKAIALDLFCVIERMQLDLQDVPGAELKPPEAIITVLFKELGTSKSKLGVTVWVP